MSPILIAGIALTLLGLAGILWSIIAVTRARRAGLDDAALKARLTRIVPVNLGALLASMLGLGLVIVALILT